MKTIRTNELFGWSRSIITALITLALLIFSSVVASAGIVMVPGDSPTIQDGIVASTNGDTVLVAAGTYTESLDFLGKEIVVLSSDGPLTTIITNSSSDNLVVFTNGETATSTLEGFTLKGGRIGALCENAAPTIRRNIFDGQSISNWGAISLGGNGYATIGTSPAIIENNTIINCANGAISTFSDTQPIIRNNILAFNSHYGIHRASESESTSPHPLMEYNCVFGNGIDYQNITPGVGVIAIDPILNSNSSLLLGSPCVNTGDPQASFNDPDGSRNDMGAVPYFATITVDTAFVPTAFPTIQSAIDAVASGGAIIVAPGTYSENLDFGSKSLSLVSSDGSSSTTIISPSSASAAPIFESVDSSFSSSIHARGSAAGPVIVIASGSGSGVIIDGFTIDGGNSVTGLACEGSDPTIQNNVFQNCVGSYDGGATWFNLCAPKILNNVFHDNITPISGSSVFVRLGVGYGTVVVSGNVMYNNISGNGPAVSLIEGDDAIVSYNVAYNNVATLGSTRRGAIYVRGANIDIHNNTNDGNTVGMTVLSSTNVDVRNNIITNSVSDGLEYLSDVGPSTNVTNDFNDVWNNAGGDYAYASAGLNSISANPAFATDYSLIAGSPCIDAGDPDPSFNDSDGSRNDMGAKAGGVDGPFVVNLNLGDSVSPSAVPTVTPTIYWSYFDNDPTGQTSYEIEVGTDNDWALAEMWTTGTTNSSDTAVLYNGAALSNHTTYHIRLRVSDGVDFSPWSALAFTVAIPGTIHVPADFATIQEAIDAALSGDSIIVAAGVYGESLRILNKSVIIQSEDGPGVTTITSEPSSNLVTFTDDGGNASTLDGFTLLGGRIGVMCENAGPIIKHNVLRDQSIHNWGAISLGGYGYASNGPSPAVIVNNTIINCANGAISTFSTVEPTIRNNILAFNGHYAIHRNSAGPTYPHPVMEYNCVFGNAVDYQNITPGIGVIAVNPLLDSNFALTDASLCIDAGDPDPLFNDLDGSRNDMGGIPYAPCTRPGDANGDLTVTIGDVTFLISYLFVKGPAPNCPNQGDVDASGELTIGDVTYLINWIFTAGPSPVLGSAGN